MALKNGEWVREGIRVIPFPSPSAVGVSVVHSATLVATLNGVRVAKTGRTTFRPERAQSPVVFTPIIKTLSHFEKRSGTRKVTIKVRINARETKQFLTLMLVPSSVPLSTTAC